MTNKIKCTNPHHEDSTASMVQYPDGWHCFGCGYYVRDVAHQPLSSLEPRYVEDITSKLEYIRTLPIVEFRGLSLPCDSFSAYVPYPNSSYYLQRLLTVGDGQSKYKGPAGHARPLLEHRPYRKEHLVVVEGELNALSIVAASVRADVVSPGSAGELGKAKHLRIYQQYANILIVGDKDAPGAKACIELKAKLLSHTPHVRIKLMEPDANDILVQYGKEALKTEIEKDLEVLGGLPRHKEPLQAPREAAASVVGRRDAIHRPSGELSRPPGSEYHTTRRAEVSGGITPVRSEGGGGGSSL